MDWTGNKRSVFTTMGATGHSTYEREQHDFYATDPVAIDRLAAKFEIPHKVWECACGAGHLSERLLQLGHEVYSSDLVERGYGKGGVDFLSFDAEKFMNEIRGVSCIITNPPYKFTTEFVLQALRLLPDGGIACFFLKTVALESKGRYDRIYRFAPPKYIFQCIERVLCVKNGDFEHFKGSSAQAYAWFVWEKGFHGKPTLDWI